MFREILRKFEEINHILVMKNGNCEMIDKYTRKLYLKFSSSIKVKEKCRILNNYYNEYIN